MSEDDEDLGKRWKKFKQENWERTNYSNKFLDDDGKEVDWLDDPVARDEYFNQIETDYTYFCYDQQDPEACQKRADFLATFRSDYDEANAEYNRCCEKYKTPGCCLKAAHYMYFNGLKKDLLKSADSDKYWNLVSNSCMAPDYPRSKQQQDNRAEACLIIYNARKELAMKGSTANIFTSKITEQAMKIDILERLHRTCMLSNVTKNWESCASLSAIFMNPKFSKIPNPPVPLDVKKGIEYAVRACEGTGNGLGHQLSCVNLAKLYERGNRVMNINKNEELSRYFKLKAWYHTDEGMMTHATANVPAAGYQIS